MELVANKPERKAQLEEYAQRRGQEPADALDDALGAYLDWELADYQEAVAGTRQGYNDVKARRTGPAAGFLDEVRLRHGFPG